MNEPSSSDSDDVVPRAKWRYLPDPVLPTTETQSTDAGDSDWDRKPSYNPDTGVVQ